jgi:hypothetical protein
MPGDVRRRVLALTVSAVLVLAACGSSSPSSTNAKPTPVTPTTGSIRIGPLTPRDPGRISPEDAAAILALGTSTVAEPDPAHAGHGATQKEVDVPLLTGDALTFADQWIAAVDSTTKYDTVEKAAALGFVRTAVPAPGVGTHWIKWSWVAEPFDPAKPSMLLFDERSDPPKLVGYSYLLQSATKPVGFAGWNDIWHQHAGLCVVNGWIDREEANGPADCAGTFLTGGDIWMLHAWVVPGWSDKWGHFANSNPMLCPAARNTPDVARCGGLTS